MKRRQIFRAQASKSQTGSSSRRFVNSGPVLPFNPASIPGCQLWLDAADTSSIALNSSSNVLAWIDKSGNGYNAVSTGTPTYLTGGGINFNGSSYFLNQTFTMNLSQRSIFIVMQETTRVYARGVITFIPTPSSGSDQTSSSGLSVETSNGLIFYNETTGGYASTLGNSTLLVKAIYNDTMNGTTGSGYLNGTNSTNVTAGYTASTCSGYGIGGRWQSGSIAGWSVLNGIIYELLVFNSVLTTIQRQKVEGYLAHKWGLQSTLPSNHPHKTTAPTYEEPVFVPTLINGTQMWLDGNDPIGTGTQPANGATVSTWVDKSGTSNNGTSGSATFLKDSLGGYLNFTGSQTYTITNPNVVVNQYFTVFIVEQIQNYNPSNTLGILAAPNEGPTNTNLVIYYNNSTNPGFAFYGNDIYATISPGYTTNAAQPTRIWSASFIPNSRNLYINGVSIGADTNNTFLTAWSGAQVGYWKYGNYKGKIRDIIICSGSIISSQRQKVEGYLAHKWGLHSSLPANHPYKTIAPTGIPISITSQSLSVLFNSGSLSVPANAALTLGTNNHTFEFWLYQTSRNFYDVPFIYGNTAGNATNNYYMNLGQYTGVLIGNGSPGGWSLNMANGLSLPALNTWSHYALVRNGNTFTLYLNGTNVASATLSISIPAQGGVMAIGGLNSGGNTITGYMANFRFVNGTAVYTSNFTPPTSPLTAIPNTQVLIQGLVDRSPNAFTVTSTGGVTLSTSVSPFV